MREGIFAPLPSSGCFSKVLIKAQGFTFQTIGSTGLFFLSVRSREIAMFGRKEERKQHTAFQSLTEKPYTL
jgi:hypothetical protein